MCRMDGKGQAGIALGGRRLGELRNISQRHWRLREFNHVDVGIKEKEEAKTMSHLLGFGVDLSLNCPWGNLQQQLALRPWSNTQGQSGRDR